MNNIYQSHPFKDAVRSLIAQHFHPSIASRFEVYFEVEMYNTDAKEAQNLRNQMRDNRFVAEVYYKHKSGISTFICDLYSWWDKKQVEFALLRFITDKARVGEIGRDWTADDKGRISEDVTSGKFETPDSEIAKGMVQTKVKKK
jgi:hypothetical protein